MFKINLIRDRKKFLVDESFFKRIDKTGTCWFWVGAKTGAGYGSYRRSGLAHRISYKHFKGCIPKNMEIDHLCNNKLCVNPDHLEAVEHRENVRRAWNLRRKDTCYRGHKLILGRKNCRECDNIRAKEYRLRVKKKNCAFTK